MSINTLHLKLINTIFRGVLAPGKKADFLFVEDLEKFEIKNTFIENKI